MLEFKEKRKSFIIISILIGVVALTCMLIINLAYTAKTDKLLFISYPRTIGISDGCWDPVDREANIFISLDRHRFPLANSIDKTPKDPYSPNVKPKDMQRTVKVYISIENVICMSILLYLFVYVLTAIWTVKYRKQHNFYEDLAKLTTIQIVLKSLFRSITIFIMSFLLIAYITWTFYIPVTLTFISAFCIIYAINFVILLKARKKYKNLS